jgi:AcrR family transcriptional regulator
MSRNHDENQRIKDERREQIMSAALRVFASKGLYAAKISDIAEAAGISQGLAYRYFGSKEDIYTTLIADAFTKLNEACHMLEAMSITPEAKIRMAVVGLLQGLDQHADSARYHLLIAQATASEAIPEEAKEAIRSSNREPYAVIARIFAEGQRTGVFKDDVPERMSLLFWSTVNGLAIYKAVHGGWPVSPDPEMIMRMFLKGRSARRRRSVGKEMPDEKQ